MESRRRLVGYILINIIVSALVAGSVIFYYDRTHKVECSPTLPNSGTALPGSGDVNVNIVGVIGAGALTDEQIIIRNDGPTALGLAGWYFTDNKGVTYTFPQLTLYPGVKMQLHSGSGKDTPTDLYWGRTTTVWASGELAALYDEHNIVRAFYRVP